MSIVLGYGIVADGHLLLIKLYSSDIDLSNLSTYEFKFDPAALPYTAINLFNIGVIFSLI